jgi:hypothetical protein
MRIRYIACFFILLASVAFQNIAYAAPERSPLQRPLEDLKRDLAKALKCTWTDSYGDPLCRTEEIPMNKAEIRFYRGKIDHIEFGPYLRMSRYMIEPTAA